MQVDQAWDFANLTFIAGVDSVYQWAQQDLEDDAFTPEDYARRLAARPPNHQSVYASDRSKGL